MQTVQAAVRGSQGLHFYQGVRRSTDMQSLPVRSRRSHSSSTSRVREVGGCDDGWGSTRDTRIEPAKPGSLVAVGAGLKFTHFWSLNWRGSRNTFSVALGSEVKKCPLRVIFFPAKLLFITRVERSAPSLHTGRPLRTFSLLFVFRTLPYEPAH